MSIWFQDHDFSEVLMCLDNHTVFFCFIDPVILLNHYSIPFLHYFFFISSMYMMMIPKYVFKFWTSFKLQNHNHLPIGPPTCTFSKHIQVCVSKIELLSCPLDLVFLKSSPFLLIADFYQLRAKDLGSFLLLLFIFHIQIAIKFFRIHLLTRTHIFHIFCFVSHLNQLDWLSAHCPVPLLYQYHLISKRSQYSWLKM